MKLRLRLFLVLALLVMLSGCMRQNVEELFRLPLPSREYTELQNKIDAVLAAGAGYSAPASGAHRQPVQLHDIDGDGENEAIAFFNVSGEKPLKIYIFRISDGKYETAAIIEGDGTGIESVYYTDMDNDGWREIIIGWKMEDLQMLRIYSLKEFQPSALATTDYMAYTVFDIDRNGRDELLAVRHNAVDFTGEVNVYRIGAEGEIEQSGTSLSYGIKKITKLAVGLLSDGKDALFVEGDFRSGGIITDIITFDGKDAFNVPARGENGLTGVYRNYTAICRDINSDGIVEIPIPRILPSRTESERVYMLFDWYCYDARGRAKLALSTFHSYSDGWYLVLPPEWGESITIRRDDTVAGERAVYFSVWNGNGPGEDFLAIYTLTDSLTGESWQERALRDGRFIIKRENEFTYAAKLIGADWEHSPDKQYLLENFFLIYYEWYTWPVVG